MIKKPKIPSNDQFREYKIRPNLEFPYQKISKSSLTIYDKDFNNPTEYSIGVGIRWRSPIGPIRLDVASGISNDNNPIRLHFFIGPQL